MNLLSALFIVMLLIASPVLADDIGVMDFEKALRNMNRVKPLQDHRYHQAKDILTRRVLDKNNRVIGAVDDVTFNMDGSVDAIMTKLDRLKLGGVVPLRLADIDVRSMSKGYRFDIAGADVEGLYPALLANIATASGGDVQVLSVNSLIDRPVSTDKFLNIGKVTDVLFDERGVMAHAIYVSVNHRTIRKQGVALPIDAFDFTQKNGRTKIMVKNGFGGSLLKFAKNQ